MCGRGHKKKRDGEEMGTEERREGEGCKQGGKEMRQEKGDLEAKNKKVNKEDSKN